MYIPIDLEPGVELGHSTLAVLLHATIDAQDWFEQFGKAMMNDPNSNLESFGNDVDKAMMEKSNERVVDYIKYVMQGTDVNDPMAESMHTQAEAEFPAYVYIPKFIETVFALVHMHTMAQQQTAQIAQSRILTPNDLRAQRMQRDKFWNDPYKKGGGN